MGRFTALEYLTKATINERPFWGFFGSDRFVNNVGYPTGIGVFIFNFGVIGFLLLCYGLYQSSVLIIKN